MTPSLHTTKRWHLGKDLYQLIATAALYGPKEGPSTVTNTTYIIARTLIYPVQPQLIIVVAITLGGGLPLVGALVGLSVRVSQSGGMWRWRP